MSTQSPPQVLAHVPAAAGQLVLDDRAVLRLSRASLRAEPPVVQFVGVMTATGHQQRLSWPA